MAGRAARKGHADGVSAINTINSITGIDLDTLTPRPNVGGLSSHGGYCGPAVKPIALNMVQQLASDPEIGLPISGIGGIATWRDAAEFILLGCGTVQVCTAAMHYGFRIVEDMIDGLKNWMDSKGFASIEDFRGLSLPRVTDWKHLDLNYKIVARINRETCIGCDLCYTACWDGAHQCIHLNGHSVPAAIERATRERIVATPVSKAAQDALNPAKTPPHRIPQVDEEECVGCNLCWLVCPVEDCITMEKIDLGKPKESWEDRCAKNPHS
jgi:dihydropyrimidine dehydrogenase (NAD+) subunit PreA